MKLRNHIILISSLVLTAILLASFQAYAETVLKQKISLDEIVVMPDFQISPGILIDSSDGKSITGWKQFVDTKAPKELILVSGVSFDMHFSHQYSTYAIQSQQTLVDHWPQTPTEVLNYAQKSYKWRSAPVLFKNENGITCISEQDNEYNFEDDFLYSYQGVCFHVNKHLAIKFTISTVRFNEFAELTTEQIVNGTHSSPRNKQLSQFTQLFLDSFKPL